MYTEEVREDEDDDIEGPDTGNVFCDALLPPFLPSIHKVSEVSTNVFTFKIMKKCEEIYFKSHFIKLIR